MNADNINKLCQLTVYPHHKILPMGWDRYSGNHPRTLCYKMIDVIRVPDGIKNEWYWFDNVVPIMSEKFIDMMSNVTIVSLFIGLIIEIMRLILEFLKCETLVREYLNILTLPRKRENFDTDWATR